MKKKMNELYEFVKDKYNVHLKDTVRDDGHQVDRFSWVT